MRQRELNFKEPGPFKNAYRDQRRLRQLTLDLFNVDSGCDFLLTLESPGKQVGGPMRAGACRFFSKGLNKELTAQDAVAIGLTSTGSLDVLSTRPARSRGVMQVPSRSNWCVDRELGRLNKLGSG